MEIAKYFERISRKRNLSNKSSDEEASKELRESSLDNSGCKGQRIVKLKANVN